MTDAVHTLLAKQDIADLAQRWGRARDQGLWDDLALTFHPGGTIKVMWFEGTHQDFIAACAKRFVPGRGTTKHFFGASVVDVDGQRALCETPAALSQAGELHGVRFTSQSFLRFLDRVERRAGEWRIVQRNAIYEGDRFMPETPVELDPAILDLYAPPFKYLAYRQHVAGLPSDRDTPMDGSESLVRLMDDARRWLHARG
ncbi:MAG: nuclear transport factor 2 family protein [Pseudomonadota bacterium]